MIRTTSVKTAILLATDTSHKNLGALADFVTSKERAKEKNRGKTRDKTTTDEELQALWAKRAAENDKFAERNKAREERLKELEQKELEFGELCEQEQSELVKAKAYREMQEVERQRSKIQESRVHATNRRSSKRSDDKHLHAVDVAKILCALDSLPETQRTWLSYAFVNPALCWISESEIEKLNQTIISKFCYVQVLNKHCPSEKKFTAMMRMIPYLMENVKITKLRGQVAYTGADLNRILKLGTKDFKRDYGKYVHSVYGIINDMHTAANLEMMPKLPGYDGLESITA